MSDLEKYYLRLPRNLQNLAVSLEGFRLQRRRYNSQFLDIYKSFKSNEYLTEKSLRQFRKNKLSKFIKHAGRNSIFWNERINNSGLDKNSDNIIDEVKKLPVLTKETVKERISDIRVETDDKILTIKTSGTTGGGLVFDSTYEAERSQLAIWWRYRKWHGISFDEWSGYFGGRKVVPFNQKKPPFWRYNFPGRQILFSGYHLNDENIPYYLKLLENKEIKWIHGYPSIVSILANFILERNLKPLPKLEIVTTGAENLLPHQRKAIEKAFRVPVREHYGQAEGVANISECEYGRFHVDEDYSHVEFVPLSDKGDEYRIIGTNWTNFAFPLIRYDTNDIATINKSSTCFCGRNGRIVERIDGRKEDYIVLPTGEKIGRLDHIFKDLVHIQEAQLYQEIQGKVEIRVVKGKKYDEVGEEEKLISNCRKYLGPDIELKVRYLDSIPKTNTGKLRFVISEC